MEQWTVEEVIEYERTHKPVKQVYGKYGTIAKRYLEQYEGLMMLHVGEVPEYLHEIDRKAEEMYDRLYAELSNRPEYKKTGSFIDNLRKEMEMQQVIEQQILAELIYI